MRVIVLAFTVSLAFAQTSPPAATPSTVAVSKLPSVSVERDGFDRAMIGFNIALILVGAFGVCAALRTLGQIQRQANLQERAIRPWIGTISIAEGDLRPDGPDHQSIHSVVTLKNTGPSVALKGFMPALISSQTAGLSNEIKGAWDRVNSVVGTQNQVNTGFVLHPGSTHEHPVFMGTPIPMHELRNGIAYVLVCIVYEDQFGKKHRTQDCFRMTLPNPEGLAVRFEAVPAYQTAD